MIVNGGDVGLLMWMCGVSDPLGPIKPMDVGVVETNNLLVTFHQLFSFSLCL